MNIIEHRQKMFSIVLLGLDFTGSMMAPLLNAA